MAPQARGDAEDPPLPLEPFSPQVPPEPLPPPELGEPRPASVGLFIQVPPPVLTGRAASLTRY